MTNDKEPGDAAESERGPFEAWADAAGFNIHRDESEKYTDYHRATTRWAWEAWQARASLAATPQPAIPPGFKVVPRENFVQPVPDHCDRIVWRNHYYALPLSAAPVPEAGQGLSDEQLEAKIEAALPLLDAASRKALTFTRWHDGIDCDYVTTTAKAFARALLSPAPAQAQWDASQIKPPGWNHVFAAFVEGAREARANPQAADADFQRAADGYTKRVFEEVDPVSEAALRTESWKTPAQAQAPVEVSGPYMPVAEVIEAGHDDLEARIRWLFNPMPEGSTLYEQTSPPPQSAQLMEPKGDTLEDNVRYLLSRCPFTVRDLSGERTGMRGREDLAGTLAITFLKMEDLAKKAGSGLMEGKDAARDVLAERQRQVAAEGYFPAHDDEHDKGELAVAAACYALRGNDPTLWITAGQRPCFGSGFLERVESWIKSKNRRSNLVRAAALLLAEIERLDRAALSQGQQTEQGKSNA